MSLGEKRPDYPLGETTQATKKSRSELPENRNPIGFSIREPQRIKNLEPKCEELRSRVLDIEEARRQEKTNGQPAAFPPTFQSQIKDVQDDIYSLKQDIRTLLKHTRSNDDDMDKMRDWLNEDYHELRNDLKKNHSDLNRSLNKDYDNLSRNLNEDYHDLSRRIDRLEGQMSQQPSAGSRGMSLLKSNYECLQKSLSAVQVRAHDNTVSIGQLTKETNSLKARTHDTEMGVQFLADEVTDFQSSKQNKASLIGGFVGSIKSTCEKFRKPPGGLFPSNPVRQPFQVTKENSDNSEINISQENYIAWLKSLNFRPPHGMCHLKKSKLSLTHYDLFSNAEMLFFLQQEGPHLSQLICLSRAERGHQNDDAAEKSLHPSDVWLYRERMMEIEYQHPNWQKMVAADKAPKYVLNLGCIYVKSPATNYGPSKKRSSAYFLVMDVTKSKKPLWLVYGYEYRVVDGTVRTYQLHKTTAFEARGTSFDLACVADSLERFQPIASSGILPMLDSTQALETIGKSACTVQPVFTKPNLVELLKTMQETWGGVV
ncbi:hypothetical protein F4778DRAFT_778789 [Xylariomycetidae sp. FL2044]|nr:hypothetical protein F4778DRAFT_778789 [Xylariomycetidae sp. FL2044]